MGVINLLNVSHLYTSWEKETDLFYKFGLTYLLLWLLLWFAYVILK